MSVETSVNPRLAALAAAEPPPGWTRSAAS